VKKPSLKSALIAFFGSRTAVGEGSLKVWGAQQRPPVDASTAEALADELVAEGVASVEERSGGRRVWRLVREEAASEPEPTPGEEPAAVAGGEFLTLSDAIAHAEEKGAGEGGCAADHRRLAGWLRELEESRKARAELGAGLEDALQRTADMAREAMTLRQERDAFRSELETATQNANRLRLELRFAQAFNGELASALGVHPETHQRDLLGRVAALLDEARAAAAAPTLDQGAIAHYLLSLPEERWASLATARQQLAQAREMAHAARLLEEAALAAVDGLLSAPAGAPAPAPELAPAPPSAPPPPPAPQAKRGPRTKDGKPRPGTMRAEILAWIRQQPKAAARVKEVAAAFDRPVPDTSSVLTTMRNAGYLRRTGPGIYQAVKP